MSSVLLHTRVWVNPWSAKTGLDEKLFFLLRMGIALCFIGHGAWGIIGKSGWLPFFEVFYIAEDSSRIWMPVIGIMDIVVGTSIFFLPTKGVLLWAAIWTIFTAALRPSAGMGMSEFFERAGNYGVPLAFLWLISGFDSRLRWWEPLKPSSLHITSRLYSFELILKLSLSMLLIGHGGLAFFQDHPVLGRHFDFLGIPVGGIEMRVFGLFELALGIAAYFKSHSNALMIFILVYKFTTELLHPISGNAVDIFETIERAGDYALPLLIMACNHYRRSSDTSVVREKYQVSP